MHFTSEPGLHFAFEPKWVRGSQELSNWELDKISALCLQTDCDLYSEQGWGLLSPLEASETLSDYLWAWLGRILTRSSEWEGIVVRLGVQRCNAVTIILITMIFSGQQNTNKMIINTQTAVRDKNGFKNVLWQSTNHSNDHKKKKKCFEPLEFWISINISFLFQMTGGLTSDSK